MSKSTKVDRKLSKRKNEKMKRSKRTSKKILKGGEDLNCDNSEGAFCNFVYNVIKESNNNCRDIRVEGENSIQN
jgi:hypothetical protein